jgi:hypothetical protein
VSRGSPLRFFIAIPPAGRRSSLRPRMALLLFCQMT